VAQTIDQGRLARKTGPARQRVWTNVDLELADARIVAELAHRVEIWAALTAPANEQTGVREPAHSLSDPTVRELLAVVEILTRREAARLAGHRRAAAD
jgi:hypothetical protein